MLKIYPEQLSSQLNKGLSAVYLLLGNDPLLLHESQNSIRQIAVTQGFNEHHTVQIDNSTDWQMVFSLCRAISLFASRQTLMIVLPENGLDTIINENLTTLVGLLHNDLLLIVRSNKLTKAQENATWFKELSTLAVIVTCQTPEQVHLPKWLATRARQHNLRLDKSACQLLCYYYEGNLLALTQALDQFSLLWPDGKLTLSRVERVINDTAHFTPFHWVDALITVQSKRALHILQQLRLEGIEPVILIRILQRELLLLITLKRQLATTPICTLFNKYNVWHNRRIMLTEAINRFSQNQLRQAIHLLVQVELTLKNDYSQSVWIKLERFSMALCCKAIADVFIDD